MLGRMEFYDYVQRNLPEYLPEQLAGASVKLREQVKNYDEELTGVMVSLPGEQVTPVIYLGGCYERYAEGANLDDVLRDLAQAVTDARTQSAMVGDPEAIMDFDFAKDKLQVRLFDTEANQKRLEPLVHHCLGDLTCAYSIVLSESQGNAMSVMVTPQIMEAWGVTKRQVHEAAMEADLERGVTLNAIGELIDSMLTGQEPDNYISPEALADGIRPDFEGMGMALMCLSNGSRLNGASMIINPEVQANIAQVLGGNYYMLPSSIHEVLVLPDTVGGPKAAELGAMVKEINETQVAPQDRLSDKVQYYDAETRSLVNAMAYEMAHGPSPMQDRRKSI